MAGLPGAGARRGIGAGPGRRGRGAEHHDRAQHKGQTGADDDADPDEVEKAT